MWKANASNRSVQRSQATTSASGFEYNLLTKVLSILAVCSLSLLLDRNVKLTGKSMQACTKMKKGERALEWDAY